MLLIDTHPLCPTASSVSGALDRLADRWVSMATVFGLPATVAPIDHSVTGLPIGVQIIGDYLEDNTTTAFAQLIEREYGGFVPPPTL